MSHPLKLLLILSVSLLLPTPAPAQSPPEGPLRLQRVKLPKVKKLPPRVLRQTPRPAAQPPRKVGWGPAESMTFQVKIAGVIAGRAALAVGKPSLVGGRRVLKVRGLGETSPFLSAIHAIREELITSIDLTGLSPLRSRQDLRDGKKTRQIDATFGEMVVLQINRQGNSSQRRRNIPRPHFDPVSGLFALRSMPLTEGEALTMLVLSGTSLYRVELKVGAPERIYLQEQPHDAIPLKGLGTRITDQGRPIEGKKVRQISIWLSADATRQPLLLQGDTKLGPIEATLTSHQPPKHRLTVKPPLLGSAR